MNKLKFTSQRRELDNALADFKVKNSELFQKEDAEEKLMESMEYLSKDLPIKDRIEKASVIAFGSTATKPSPYAVLNGMDVKVTGA